MTELSRKAGFCETLSYVFHELSHNESICALRARITGPLTEEIARRALFRCQNRHPMLHATARKHDDSSIEWCFDVDFAASRGVDAVPLTWQRRTDDAEVNRVIDAELAEAGGKGDYPWWAVILSDGHHHDVVFVIPHYMTDATSFISLFKLFVENCQFLSAGRESHIQKTTLPIPEPVDQLLVNTTGDWGAMDPVGENEPWPWQAFAPRDQRQSHNIWFNLGRTVSDRLIKRCKDEGVSVNSALSAAYLLATRSVFFQDQKERNLSFSAAVSLRRYCQPPYYDDSFAWHIAQYSFSQLVGSESAFWKIASELGDKLKNHMDEQASGGFFPAQFNPGDFSAAMEQMFHHDDEVRAFASPLISNLGVVELPESYGPYQVEDLCWTTKLICGRNLASLYTLTLRGKMSFCLAYTTPLISDQMAQAIVDGFINVIKQQINRQMHQQAAGS